jgi:cell division protein FtsN
MMIMRFFIIFACLMLVCCYEFSSFVGVVRAHAEEEKQVSSDKKEGDLSSVSHKSINVKKYVLWVGSSQDLIKAELEKGLYAGFGQPVEVVTVDLKNKGMWHRTYVGRFASKSEAKEFKKELEKSLNLQWAQIIIIK